jgi:hypothetical protein
MLLAPAALVVTEMETQMVTATGRQMGMGLARHLASRMRTGLLVYG